MECEASIVQASTALRLALDHLMETTFVKEETLEEDKLEQFMLLVSQYDENAIRRCMRMTKPQSVDNSNWNRNGDDNSRYHYQDDESYTGRLPLHLACDKSAPLAVIRWLLEHDNGKETIRISDMWGDLPLHTICSRQNVTQVVKLLLEADDEIARRELPRREPKAEDTVGDGNSNEDDDPDAIATPSSSPTIFTKDKDGSLPLHMACRYLAPPEVIKLLLEHDRTPRKDTLSEPGIYGQLPLTIACRCQSTAAVIQLLIDNDIGKETVVTTDSVGRLPIHVALLRKPKDGVIRLLLQGMLYGRMERKGLHGWKRDMKNIHTALSTYERDWDVRDKLNVIQDTLRIFVEQTHALELALWKVQCWMQIWWTMVERQHGNTFDAPSTFSIIAPLSQINVRVLCREFGRAQTAGSRTKWMG